MTVGHEMRGSAVQTT